MAIRSRLSSYCNTVSILITADHCTWLSHNEVMKYYPWSTDNNVSHNATTLCSSKSHAITVYYTLWSSSQYICTCFYSSAVEIILKLSSHSGIVYHIQSDVHPGLGYIVLFKLSDGTTADYTARLPQLPRGMYKVDTTICMQTPADTRLQMRWSVIHFFTTAPNCAFTSVMVCDDYRYLLCPKCNPRCRGQINWCCVHLHMILTTNV